MNTTLKFFMRLERLPRKKARAIINAHEKKMRAYGVVTRRTSRAMYESTYSRWY